MLLSLTLASILACTGDPGTDDLVRELQKIEVKNTSGELVTAHAQAVRQRLRDAGLRESKQWQALKSRADWEKYLAPRMQALRTSLGSYPAPPRDLNVKIRKTLRGDGFLIDCLTYESRPGLMVTANLYRPAKARDSMPGFILVHSHHNPKTEGELQDMGQMWARAGCYVLVLDQLGHGERRQHPFRSSADYPKSFRAGRQDYYFRHNLAILLDTLGDSLMGWMVYDISRGVDLLLSRPGIDPKRIIILGAVAGGGDPCAVAAALDKRITAAGPFNFGGPQPETRYPLPADAETSFLYSGSGSWETTRNIRLSARDGFLPWVIVGSFAPRRHIYGHEFSWDEGHDPVWKRLKQIHTWYDMPAHLSVAHGTGLLSGRPPVASHCNNIGAVHRKGIHEALKRWFDISAKESEKRDRRSASELYVLAKDERLQLVHQLAGKIADERLALARKERESATQVDLRNRLRKGLANCLGDVEPFRPKGNALGVPFHVAKDVSGRWMYLTGASDVAALILTPRNAKGKLPTTIAVAQGGSREFLKHRAGEIADLLKKGNVVVLADLGGTSRIAPGGNRGRGSSSTSLAASQLMLGETALGSRIRELRTLLKQVKTHPSVDAKRISLWGESFAPQNSKDTTIAVPLDAQQPTMAEPLGGLLVLLTGLYEDDIVSIRACGTLAGYRSLYRSTFQHVPYDVVVPGVLKVGDLCDVVEVQAPRRIQLERLVDGHNRAVSLVDVQRIYAEARTAYQKAKAGDHLVTKE